MFFLSGYKSEVVLLQIRRNIPFVVVGGQPFWSRKEVKDVMAYVKLAVTPEDNLSLMRIINNLSSPNYSMPSLSQECRHLLAGQHSGMMSTSGSCCQMQHGPANRVSDQTTSCLMCVVAIRCAAGLFDSRHC